MAKAESVPSEAKELVDLVVSYAKQETIDPLKRLGKNVAFGVVGAVLVGTGTLFLSLSALRALQTETDTFDDNLTWAPYLIVAVLLVVMAAVSWAALGPGSGDDGKGGAK
ncbi:MAG: phage holin family protein [Acidimicrobiia bacterium]